MRPKAREGGFHGARRKHRSILGYVVAYGTPLVTVFWFYLQISNKWNRLRGSLFYLINKQTKEQGN